MSIDAEVLDALTNRLTDKVPRFKREEERRTARVDAIAILKDHPGLTVIEAKTWPRTS